MNIQNVARLVCAQTIGVTAFAVAFGVTGFLVPRLAHSQEESTLKSNLGIVEGDKVMKGQADFVVALRLHFDGSAFCTGTVVGNYWVLTAKHCLYDKKKKAIPLKNIYIKTGIDRIVRYPEFEIEKKVENSNYDVALLKVRGKISSDTVPIARIRQEDPHPIGTKFTAFGWGATSYVDDPHKLEPAASLRKLRLLQVGQCAQEFVNLFLCASFPRKGRGVYYGDSGGPAIVDQGPLKNELFAVLHGGDVPDWIPPNNALYTPSSWFYDWAAVYINTR